MINTTNEFREKFQQALDLKNSGDLESAYTLLSDIASKNPNSAPALGVLADVAYSKGLIQEAAEWFRKVTILSPKSEMASLGLFHSLFDLGDTNGAFDEMKRFMSIQHSDEYELLLSEITEALRKDELNRLN
jgi:tetratricopeptide (TPR) repeat protein